MTEGRLDPRVRSLLADELAERELEMDVAQRMLDKTQRLESEALGRALRDILEEG